MNGAVFLPTHISSTVTAGYACFPIVMYVNDQVQTVIAQTKITDISAHERIARLERNSARAAALARARKRMGNWVGEEFSDKGLTALRMKAGLSQASLASQLGTQQSNVSRWEKSPGDLQYSTIKKMAQAFGVPASEVISAIEAASQAQGVAA